MHRTSSSARTARRSIAIAAIGAFLLTALTLLAPTPALTSASAAAWTVDTAGRTEAEIRARWTQLQPAYSGGAYAVVPGVVAPYTPGEAAGPFRADGVNMINFGRFLAGLPSDVTLTADRNLQAQYGAVLLRASTFSHEPPKPADMTDAFYTTALGSTRSSNIGSGHADSESFQKSCLDDSSPSNTPMVGHRRWLLNPVMLYSGIGFADYRHTTYSFDRSRPAADVSYNYIAWPSAGPFPTEFTNRLTPWSITLNPARYDWDASGHSATIRRVSDGKTWVMNASDTNVSGEYFKADFAGYGVGNAFIFRPNPADLPAGYQAGEQYDVTLSGGIYAEGTRTPVAVTYRTAFITLGAVAPPVVPDPTPTSSPIYRFYNISNGSHFYTASAVERDTVIARLSSTYRLEGVAYALDPTNEANCSPLYRFYNRSNGSHFYTASAAEKDAVIAGLAAKYAYEGPAYNVSLTATGCSPMYRFYNKVNGSHFYTASATERDQVMTTLSGTYGFDGVAYYIGQ